MDSVIHEFNCLAREVSARLDATFNCPDITPFVSEMISLVKENQALKERFTSSTIQFWDSKEIEHEEIELCCHALKWS